MTTPPAKIQISIRVENDLLERVDRLATKDKRRRSDVIRLAIEEYVRGKR